MWIKWKEGSCLRGEWSGLGKGVDVLERETERDRLLQVYHRRILLVLHIRVLPVQQDK